VTELADGVDLKLAIRSRGPWPAADAAALAATLADALAAAHAQGVVHRDVKPNNVMLARDGSVRLLDFGLARGSGIDVTTLTRTGTMLGTPGYMSPEQFDAHGVDERSCRERCAPACPPGSSAS
jgi:serine/threonine-protein kinase